jgi:tetratricopeptide (TPR) repeat protein
MPELDRHQTFRQDQVSRKKWSIEDSDREALIAMARLQRGLKSPDECSAYYQIAFDAKRDFATLMEWANAMAHFGRFEQALQLYLQAVELLHLTPEQLFEIHKAMGNLFLRNLDYDSAEENYHKAFALFPQSHDLLVNLGTLELHRGNIEGAVERFRESVLINRFNERGWIGLALAHRQFSDFELSWANLIEALDLKPDQMTALQLMVEWAYQDGKIQEAIQYLIRAVELRPQDASLFLLLAQLLYDLGNLRAACEYAQQALNINPIIQGAESLLSQIATRLKSTEMSVATSNK